MVRVGADKIVVVVNRDLAGEHILARVLIAAIADKALLVAGINHRRAARKHHHGVAQRDALQPFGVGNGRVGLAHEQRKATHVVIAEEGRQLQRRRRAAFIEIVHREHARQPLAALIARHHVRHRRLQREIEHGGQAIDARMPRQCARIAIEHFAEDMEIRDACARGALSMAGANTVQNSGLTWRAVSMRKPSTPKSIDPLADRSRSCPPARADARS